MLPLQKKSLGGSIKYIIPTWMLDRTDEIDDFKNMSIVDFCRNVIDIENGDMVYLRYFVWEFALKATEWSYNKLMNMIGKLNKHEQFFLVQLIHH